MRLSARVRRGSALSVTSASPGKAYEVSAVTGTGSPSTVSPIPSTGVWIRSMPGIGEYGPVAVREARLRRQRPSTGKSRR
jgi:hypothetical protein